MNGISFGDLEGNIFAKKGKGLCRKWLVVLGASCGISSVSPSSATQRNRADQEFRPEIFAGVLQGFNSSIAVSDLSLVRLYCSCSVLFYCVLLPSLCPFPRSVLFLVHLFCPFNRLLLPLCAADSRRENSMPPDWCWAAGGLLLGTEQEVRPVTIGGTVPPLLFWRGAAGRCRSR
ncbi:unnamed protein product [Cuscuta campestris]|uniref:Uncharacterized protein n=1 Tax=Cuscuta campestris TaxID=132261 RepID=A0A484KDA8_9ASTE|nr:unnamed protein product [Cuscuta campestris]